MPALRSWCALAVAALLLSGCSYSDSALDSVFGPQNPAAQAPAGAAAQSSAPIAAAPLPGAPPSAAHASAPVTGNATGTYVGEKVAELRRDLQQVDDNLARLSVPVLALHGTADRVTPPHGSHRLINEASSSDKTLLLYDGLFHDLLHEPEHDRVVGDIASWIDARLGPALASATAPAPVAR